MEYAEEAEIGAAFINTQWYVLIRQNLIEIEHTQPSKGTPLQHYNTTEDAFSVGNL